MLDTDCYGYQRGEFRRFGDLGRSSCFRLSQYGKFDYVVVGDLASQFTLFDDALIVVYSTHWGSRPRDT